MLLKDDAYISEPLDGMQELTVNLDDVCALERTVLGYPRRQRPMPAKLYQASHPHVIGALCVRNGLFGLVTHELVAFLRREIGSRSAVEIGAGDGCLAEALGIPAFDNYSHEWHPIRQHFEALQQTPVQYGKNVCKMEGEEVAEQIKPQVIIANWLMWKFKVKHFARGGNALSPDPDVLLANCEKLIFIGNDSAHRLHPLLEVPHEILKPRWLYSRGLKGTNFIAIWDGKR